MALTIGADDELLGALDLGDINYLDALSDVGARRRVRRGRMAAYGGQRMMARRLIPQVPGAPAVGIRLAPLGFPNVTFGAATGTALSTTTRPQRPFKAKRLIVGIARTGATSTGLVTVTSLNIGVSNQFVGTGPISADAFGPGAFDANLELSASTTALDIVVGFAISAAPTTTDTVVCNATMIGEAVGA